MKPLALLLAVIVIAATFDVCLAETEKMATVDYIGYVKDYTFWHSKMPAKETKQKIEFLLLVIVQDGQKLIIKERNPSAELKKFLTDVKVGTDIYLTVGSSFMGGPSGAEDVIKSMTNLSTDKKYNR